MLLWVESVDQSEASTSERESSAGLHGMTAGEKMLHNALCNGTAMKIHCENEVMSVISFTTWYCGHAVSIALSYNYELALPIDTTLPILQHRFPHTRLAAFPAETLRCS